VENSSLSPPLRQNIPRFLRIYDSKPFFNLLWTTKPSCAGISSPRQAPWRIALQAPLVTPRSGAFFLRSRWPRRFDGGLEFLFRHVGDADGLLCLMLGETHAFGDLFLRQLMEDALLKLI
jgi:hypothetical protein